MLISQVLEEQSIVDSLRLVNWKPSLIKLPLNDDFNLKFCDHDIPFLLKLFFFSSDFTVNTENGSRMNGNNLRTVGLGTTIISYEHYMSLPFLQG